MKKLISLLIVIFMICSVLTGCGFDNVFKWMSTTKPKTQIIPNFEHGDNLTNEDFYFITKHLQYKGIENPIYPSDFSDSVDDFTKRWGTFDATIFKIKIDTTAPAYYICAYIDEDTLKAMPLSPFSIDYGSEIKYFVWYKFEHKNDISERIDNLVFMGAYAVYDALFEEDLLNSRKTNYACKYFVPLLDGYSDVESDLVSKYYVSEYVYIKSSTDLGYEDYIFIPHGTYKQLYGKKRNLIINGDGDYCLYVLSSSDIYNPNTFSFESYRKEIGYLYDEMLPYLTVIENTDKNSGFKIYLNLDYFSNTKNSLLKIYDIGLI